MLCRKRKSQVANFMRISTVNNRKKLNAICTSGKVEVIIKCWNYTA
jgi:hypothetical protein